MKISVILCVISFAVAAYLYSEEIKELNQYNSNYFAFSSKVDEINNSLTSVLHSNIPEPPTPDKLIFLAAITAFFGGIGVGVLISLVVKQARKTFTDRAPA